MANQKYIHYILLKKLQLHQDPEFTDTMKKSL